MEDFNLKELNFSIVNSSIEEELARDNLAPFSFLDFIKYLQTEYAPEKYSFFYSFYLKQWYINKETDKDKQTLKYKEFYKQFIQEIILSYTTETEKQFLSKIDYNNPTDLDIIVPFYANKLTEVATFYRSKREESKYVIDKNKLKGSTTGVQRAIFDNIYNYAINSEDVLLTYGGSLSSVINDFNIDIEEYVDVYGDYFDLYRDVTLSDTDINDTVRKTLYDNNLHDTKAEYFFDPDALEVLRSNSFLRLLGGFKINPPAFSSTDLKSVCNPEDSIFDEINTAFTKGGLSLGEVYTLKRKFLAKYASSDFYYIDTTGVVPTSGLLFEAEQPTNNLLNLQTGDIAAVQSNEQKLLRDVGLFFKPDDFGIFKLNAVKSSYELDVENLENDKIYVFPDPNIYGNVGVNSLSSYPLVFTYDYRENIKDISSGASIGDPKITNKSLTIEPYITKQRRTQELSELNTLGYNLNFSDLYNKGKIRKVGYDCFGNEYALLKDSSLKNRSSVSLDYVLSLTLNGHLFFDNVFDEGANFDYDDVDPPCIQITNNKGEEEWISRSGITTDTNGFYYPPTENPLFLSFRQFSPYEPLRGQSVCNVDQFVTEGGLFNSGDTQEDAESISGILKDGSTFKRGDGQDQNDTNLSESFLIENGFPQDLDLYYSYYVTGRTFDIDGIREEYDASKFGSNVNVSTKLSRDQGLDFYNVILPENRTITISNQENNDFDTVVERLDQTGKMFVKLQGTSLSYPLSSILANTLNKYSDEIRLDIKDNIIDFDVIGDTIFLVTPNILLIDKLNYSSETNGFKIPNTANNVFNLDSNNKLNTLSNRLYTSKIKSNNNDTSAVFFTIFKTIKKDIFTGEDLPANYWYVYPEIYQYMSTTNKTIRVYPQTLDQQDLVSFSTGVRNCPVLLGNFTPEKIKTPKLTFNSVNKKLKLTYLVVDQNNVTHVHDCTFKWVSGVLTLEDVIKYVPSDITIRTTTFSDETLFTDINNSSGGYRLLNNTLEIGGVAL